MGKDRLEDYIKDQLFDHESTADADLIWKNIQNKETKRKPIFWKFLFGGFLLLGGLGALWFTMNESAFENNQQTNHVVEKQQNPKSTDDLKTDLKGQEDGKVNADLAIEIESEELKEVSNKNQNLPFKTLKTENQKSSTLTSSTLTSSTLTSSTLTSSTLTSNNLTSSTLTSNNLTSNNLTSSNLTSSNLTSNNLSSKNLNSNLLKAIYVSQLDVELPFYSREQIELKHELSVKDPVALVGESAWTQALGVTGAYFKGSRTLTAKDSINDLLDRRKANEKFLEEWGVGISLDMIHKSGVFLGTGLSYNQINDRSILRENVLEMIVPSPEQGVSGAYNLSYETEKIRYNKIRMIDIPIYLGYMISRSKISYSAKAGININLLSRAKGNIIGPEGFENVNNPDKFQHSVGLSYEFQLGLHYEVREDLFLSMHPSFKQYANSFASDVNGIDQKYSNYGLKLMMSKRF